MPIHSEEYPDSDMSHWVAEKADHTLEAACRLVDWFREKNLNLLPLEKEDVIQQLFSIIFDAAKLSAFGHENIKSWSRDWVELMFDQGYDRFIEFRQRVTRETQNDAPPSEWPLSAKKTIELFDAIDVVLKSDESDKSYMRTQITQLASQLIESKFSTARTLSDKLKDLIDDQAVHVRISWPEFIAESRALVQKGRESFMEQARQSTKSWA